MARRIITAREQHEMLSPWRTAAPWHSKEGDPTYTLPVSELQHYRQFNPGIETPKDYFDSTWYATSYDDEIQKPSGHTRKRVGDDGFWDGGGDEGSTESDLADAFGNGDKLPPVEITTNGVGAILSDGNHRVNMAEMFSRPDLDSYIHYDPHLYDGEFDMLINKDTQIGKHVHDLVQTHPYKPIGDTAPATRSLFRRHPETNEWQRGTYEMGSPAQYVDTPDYLKQMKQEVPGFKDQGLGTYWDVDWGSGPESTNGRFLHARRGVTDGPYRPR